MAILKQITNIIENWFINSDAINETSKGDITEIDLTTITNFPLVHIVYQYTAYSVDYSTINYQVYLLDTYYENQDNKLDILDNMNEVATQFVSACNNGSIFNSQIRLASVPTGTIQYDQLKNRLYGISLNISLNKPNGLINCG